MGLCPVAGTLPRAAATRQETISNWTHTIFSCTLFGVGPSVNDVGKDSFLAHLFGADMSAEHPDPVQWDKVAAELQAARDAQRRTWGDIARTTLSRYLADEASSIERAQVESAIEALPELKLLTDLV